MLGAFVGCAQTESQRFASTLAVYDGVLDGIATVAEADGFTADEARSIRSSIDTIDLAFETWKLKIKSGGEFDYAGILEEVARLARMEALGKGRLTDGTEHDAGDRGDGEPDPADRAGDGGEP